MKKILALSLMLVFVLSIGAMAQIIDYDLGPLTNNQKLEAKTDLTITIDEYARVWITSNKLFQSDETQGKANILGRPGLYTSNKWQVRAVAVDYFKTQREKFASSDYFWPEAEEEWVGEEDGYDKKGGAYFNVESNCDTEVNVAFAWDEGSDMASELVLWVFRHDEPNWPPVNDGDADASLLSTRGTSQMKFDHDYVGPHENGKEYKIGGALFIDYISQQLATTYEGVITITVAAR